ncbi:DUF2141 domain-containing protein [Arenibacter sp. TNZ]|jgi:uncharacterized protein (DUF2141 family)|nr:DUF2141 domain-containing protein [Arenibacter sp. TNZ]
MVGYLKKYIWLVLILFPFSGMSQNKLSVVVHGVKSSIGNINIAIYNKSEGFLKFEEVYKVERITATEVTTHFKISDLPKGEYAMAIFHDENENDKLDTNWLGIPKEPIAFSNAKLKTFGPPSYKECAFNLNKDLELKMEFN